MAHGVTLKLRAIRVRTRKYRPLRARGRGLYLTSWGLGPDGRVVEGALPAQPQKVVLPGKPMARGSKKDIPSAEYFDYGRGLRRIGRNGRSVFDYLRAAKASGLPVDWKGAEGAEEAA